MRDRDLVRLYWPIQLRPAFDALLDIDEAMGDVVARATEPALAGIKLAWWRERLQELDEGRVPAEPRLQAAADVLLPAGLSGASLAVLEDGWAAMLDENSDVERAANRGAKLFDMASSLLGTSDPLAEPVGELFALASLRRRGLAAGHHLPSLDRLANHRFARELRPLTALAALAARDLRRGGPPFEPEATPGRAWVLIKHRLTGRID